MTRLITLFIYIYLYTLLFIDDKIIADEIQAHSQKVTCLDLGETGRVLVTGGQDRNINLWAFGNEKCFMVCINLRYISYRFLSTYTKYASYMLMIDFEFSCTVVGWSQRAN